MTLLLVGLVLGASPSMAKVKKQTDPKQCSTLEIIEQVNNHWQLTNKPEVTASWDEAAYQTGNMEAYKLTGTAQYLEYADKWARHNKFSGARGTDRSLWLKNYQKYGEDANHVLFADWQICFQTYLDLYEMNPNPYKMARAKEVMDYQCSTRATDYWWWADALYMAMPVFSKLARLTGDNTYLDKMTACFLHSDSLMYDQDAHLYFRDGRFVYPAHQTDAGKKDFWARGNGWVLAAFAKVLQDMPAGYVHRSLFVQRFQSLAAAVAQCQQKEGYWTRSMLDAKQAEGPETSGTAFFTYGLLWGMNHGLLDEATYLPVVNKAWKYLTGKALQPDGSVGYVQPIGDKAIKGQQLSAQSTANFGTGAFLLAACEKVRFDNRAAAADYQVTVTNNSKELRQEVVELDAKTIYQKMGIDGGRQFIVLNALGQQVPYQLTYDGKVLIEACVRPGGVADFTFRKGTPKQFKNAVYGRQYPERVDDIAWENDRCSFRIYGPALQRTGEDAYGTDVWLKNTPDLVNEQRYYTEDYYKPIIANYRKTGRKASGDSLEFITSYHLDQGYGLDCYKVGPTLGCGAPALMDGDNLIMPYCYKDYQILDNGPLRFTVQVNYNPATIKGQENVVEHRIISLDKCSNFNKYTVWYDNLISPVSFASGVVIHSEDTESVELANNYIAYADPTDNPKGQNFQIFVGALFPNGVAQTKTLMYQNPTRGNAGHALGIVNNYKGERYTYYAGSAWSKYECHTMDEWKARIAHFLKGLQQPLVVK